MSAVGQLFSRRPAMSGTVVPPLINAIQAGVKGGKYTRHGNNRKANLSRAQQAASRWFKKDGTLKAGAPTGAHAQEHAAWVKQLATSLEHSAPPSRAGSRASSRASSRAKSRSSRSRSRSSKSVGTGSSRGSKSPVGSRHSKHSSSSRASSRGISGSRSGSRGKAPTLGNLAGVSKRGYTRRAVGAPPAQGSFAMLMKMHNTTKYLWWIKVEQKSRGQATITTIHGTEGGKMASHGKTVSTGSAGRSPHEQALRDALVLWEQKKKEGYTEVRAISRKSRAGNLKSLNNFVPFAK